MKNAKILNGFLGKAKEFWDNFPEYCKKLGISNLDIQEMKKELEKANNKRSKRK